MGNVQCAIAALILGLVLSIGDASAQSQPASEARIRELLAISNADQNIKQMIPLINAQVMGMVLRNVPNVTPEAKAAVTDAMEKTMLENASVFTEIAIPIYQKHLTDEEVMGWIAFMKTPVGQSFVRKSPLIAVDMMASGAKVGEALAEKAREAAVKTLREQGYSL